MKNLIVVLAAFCSFSAFATTTVKCTSAKYFVQISDIEDFSFSNYGIDGVMNDGAEVEMEKSYLSDRIIAFSLTVDGQSKKFEVSAIKTEAGTYKGTIFFDESAEAVVCTRL